MEKIGPIKQILPNFVKYKQSLGYKYNNINHYYVLDKILLANDIFDLNDSKKIFEILVENETNENRKKKNYSCLKQLYEYLKIIGYKDLYLKEYGFNTTSNFKPTILTIKQLNIFFETLDNYCNNSKNKEDYVFSILFRLIYSCGLRIIEPLNLKITDYSKENRTIYIKESKDNVTRELPLSDSMNKILKSYISNVNQSLDDSIKNITDKLDAVDMLKDGGTKIYKSKDKDMTIITCKTLDGNKDIYIGDYSMKHESSMCKR